MTTKPLTSTTFFEEAMVIVEKFKATQAETMYEAAKICAETISTGGTVHVLGSGHSVGVGMELIGRAGNIEGFHQMMTSHFVTKGDVPLEVFRDKVNYFERTPGLADQFYSLYPMNPRDAFIIISNSGINGIVVDMAIKAKEMGHKVIVITSLLHTMAESSRHPSGKKLMDFGDVVIDNCGPQGDALIPLENGAKIGSISSIIGVLLAHTLTAMVVEIINKEDIKAVKFT